MNSSTEKISVIFFGTPDFSCFALKALLENPQYHVKLVVTQPDRPSGRGSRLTAPPVKELAQQNGCPVLQPLKIKKELESFLSDARSQGPFDIGVVIAFGQILPLEVLALPKHGCINVHASILPRWRGAAPIQRSILAGDPETGVCLMQMEAGLDTGPVFSMLRIPLNDETTGGGLHDSLGQMGADLLQRDLQRIVSGEIPAVQQPVEGVTYAHKITATDLVIDWSKPADEIVRQIRAFSPLPSANTSIDGERLKVTKARVLPPGNHLTEAHGIITFVDNRNIHVSCGQGEIALEEVQLAGRKKLPVMEFLKGYSVRTGQRLG